MSHLLVARVTASPQLLPGRRHLELVAVASEGEVLYSDITAPPNTLCPRGTPRPQVSIRIPNHCDLSPAYQLDVLEEAAACNADSGGGREGWP